MSQSEQPHADHVATAKAVGHTSVMPETGKRFYSWQTIASLTGTTAAVTMIWSVLGDVAGPIFATKLTLLVISVIVVGTLALFTEPPKNVKTSWKCKGQKFVQAAINSCLVYSTSIGTVTTTGMAVAATG